MLNYKVGDLVDALDTGEVRFIGHQANCFCTMNSGVAKAIRLRWPSVYAADCETRKGDPDKLGSFTVEIVKTATGLLGGVVFNLYGQFNYGYDAKGYTDYEALKSSMQGMADDIAWMDKPVKIGFPKIGAGLGGGNWDKISAIIEEVFDEHDVTIYVLRESDVPERS
ncbi:hypothetical protein PHB09_002 [Pseudomonas phage PHB09]|uniref:Macro domain-containing protein n=1 Tax=Pseudomonas phage PHB09 TaxID=2867265 RepID=A0AAE8XGD4_9CAUD|nr:hypothetical protein QGX10_gp002 [Pseudomonas phage PHB09]UAV84498.1 hypothetical protein PHB09_002 [Pseudomonas phage PHB09]